MPTHTRTEDTSSQPSQSPHIDPAEDDSHLDLLCSEEDEDIFTLSALSRPTSNENSTAKGSGEISPGDDSVDSKLAILRSSLLEEVSDRDSKEVESQDSGTEMPQVKDKPKNGNGIEQLRKRSQRGSMFENDEKLDRYLQEQQMADGSSDSVFFTDGGGVEFSRDDHIASPLSPDEHTPLLGEPAQSSPLPPVDEEEEPDGGAMSRATASGEKVPKITEEPVVFKNLPPLKCSMMLGNEAALAKLMDTADTVVKDAVKLIHSSLGKPVHLPTCSFSHCVHTSPLFTIPPIYTPLLTPPLPAHSQRTLRRLLPPVTLAWTRRTTESSAEQCWRLPSSQPSYKTWSLCTGRAVVIVT